MKRLWFALASLVLMASPAPAGDFPSGPISYLIPAQPGERFDLVSGAQLPLLAKDLGQPLVIARYAGNRGGESLMKLSAAKADGYTISGFTLPDMVLQPMVHSEAGYKSDILKTVMIFNFIPDVLAVRKDSSFTTLQELLETATKKPGSIVLAGSGTMTTGRFAAARLSTLAGCPLPYIPGTSIESLISALADKRLDGLILSSDIAHAHSQDIKLLAVASQERLAAFPDVPTFKEAGYDLINGIHQGCAVPQHTPDDIVEKLYQAFHTGNTDQAFREQMTRQGIVPVNYNPQESAALIQELSSRHAALQPDLKK